MYNPFTGNNPPITRQADFIGYEDKFAALKSLIANGQNVVIKGVEGSGKSSFVNCFFTRKYIQQMARERKTLIRMTDFPLDKDSEGIYRYLTDGVLSSIDALDCEETMDEYERLQKAVKKAVESKMDEAARFQEICQCLQWEDYNVMLVIDGFERFIFSSHVTMEHHNIINNLFSKNLKMIVTTNYDFSKDSLPASVSGSFALQKFAGNEITLTGLTREDCELLLIDGNFSMEEIEQLWLLSGGIPLILRRAAYYRFEHNAAKEEVSWMQILSEVIEDKFASECLQRWCKWLSAAQVAVINELAAKGKGAYPIENANLLPATSALLARGFLANPIDKETKKEIRGLYRFNSLVLKQYCRTHEIVVEDPNKLISVPSVTTSASKNAPELSEQEIIDRYNAIAVQKGLPRAISFRDPIPRELLRQYLISQEDMDRYDEKVQTLINTGIRVDQTMLGIDMPDYSAPFLEFAKALELHLNVTLKPLLQKIDPDYLLPNKRYLGMENKNITLGNFEAILNYSYRYTYFTDIAGDYCADHQLGSFPSSWWDKLRRSISYIQTEKDFNGESASGIRNDMAHYMVSSERGLALLKTMFMGDRSLFNRSQALYEAAKKANLI